MATTQKTCYRRRRNTGTLTLTGVVDIFEAEALKSEAVRALNDSEASSVVVNLAQLTRFDLSALQILLALQNDVVAAGRKFTINSPRPDLTKTLEDLGLGATG